MTVERLRRAYRSARAPANLTGVAVERFVAAHSARTATGWQTPAWATAAVFAVTVVLVAAQDRHDVPHAPSVWSLSHLQSPARLQGDLRLPTQGALPLASVSAARSLLVAATAPPSGSFETVRPPSNPFTNTFPEEKQP